MNMFRCFFAAGMLALAITLSGCFQKPSEETLEMAEELEGHAQIFRIAFGSCNDTRMSQTYWRAVAASTPDIFIWAGNSSQVATNLPGTITNYHAIVFNPYYQSLLGQQVPAIGTLGKSEFDVARLGKDAPDRAAYQSAYLDFLGISTNDWPVGRSALFSRWDFEGDPADTNQGDICVILLDTQTFRDKPGPESDVLGEEQWEWLAEQLNETNLVGINLIVSAIPIINTNLTAEKWADYPKARARLFDMLITNAVPGCIFLSGGTGYGELSRIDLPDGHYPFFELTAGGLNYINMDHVVQANYHRVGERVTDPNFGLVTIDWRPEVAPQGGTGVPVTLQLRNARNEKRMELTIQLLD